jgi:transposase InsO family protein
VEADARVVDQIRAIHGEHRGAYGAPRVQAELRDRGERVNHKRVRRLMREGGIVGRHLRRRVFEWLTYYNTRRRHSTIGYQTPAAYERQMIIGKLATVA